MRETRDLDYRQPSSEDAEPDKPEIVSGHLAARRMQRRVLCVCSVLGVAGLVFLGGALLWSAPPAIFMEQPSR
jgi:hypothetical protein